MKKFFNWTNYLVFVLIGLFVLSLFGCDMARNDVLTDLLYEYNAIDHKLYDGTDIFPGGFAAMGFSDYESIAAYIHTNISYQAEEGNSDNWQDPRDTMDKGTGDCEDFAILFMNIAYFAFGEKCTLVLVDIDDIVRTIEDGGDPNHAVVKVPGGAIIDPWSGIEETYSWICYSYEFDIVFN